MIRRIGDAENPYIVRVSEDQYAGPRSVYPTVSPDYGGFDVQGPESTNVETRTHLLGLPPGSNRTILQRKQLREYKDQGDKPFHLEGIEPPDQLSLPSAREMEPRLKAQDDELEQLIADDFVRRIGTRKVKSR